MGSHTIAGISAIRMWFRTDYISNYSIIGGLQVGLPVFVVVTVVTVAQGQLSL
jgi:hypothetical protein